LWNKSPQAYLQVQAVLQSFIRQQRLRYRERMWKAAIAMAAQEYAHAGRYMLAAACSDPRRFLERALYPLRRPAKIKIGVSPEDFKKSGGRLWPSASPSLWQNHPETN